MTTAYFVRQENDRLWRVISGLTIIWFLLFFNLHALAHVASVQVLFISVIFFSFEKSIDLTVDWRNVPASLKIQIKTLEFLHH